jgi:hypothetical protein
MSASRRRSAPGVLNWRKQGKPLIDIVLDLLSANAKFGAAFFGDQRPTFSVNSTQRW